MKKAFLLILILMVSVISTACINNLAVQELNNKAKEFLDQGDYENAIGRLKSSIDLDNNVFETHYNLGIAYTKAENYDEAISEFEKAINLKQDVDITYYSLAVAYENKGKSLINTPLTTEDDLNSTFSELSQDQRIEIVDLFNKAIENYNIYIKKTSENIDEVNKRIESLQSEINKYQY